MEYWSVGVLRQVRIAPRSGLKPLSGRQIVCSTFRAHGNGTISIPPPLSAPATPRPRGCNSDLAQYSHTPVLHHSARPESRTRTRTTTTTRTRTRTRTKAPCEGGIKTGIVLGLKPQAQSCHPFGISRHPPGQSPTCPYGQRPTNLSILWRRIHDRLTPTVTRPWL
jgi:hypothetical protein